MKRITILSLVLICSFCVNAQTPCLTDRIDSLIGTVVTKATPGAVVGVVQDGTILYKKTVGIANLEDGFWSRSRMMHLADLP